MLNFCTLFNKHYLVRAFTMFESLKKTQCKFHLYIYAFDDETYEALEKIQDSFFTLISLDEFESKDLKEIKKNRNAKEYCWTCTPFIIHHSMITFNLDHCTYVDADLYFFNSPDKLIAEIPENYSVMITEHRYSIEYDQTDASGKYCVQFVYFKNRNAGLDVLNWWKDRCAEWCFDRVEDGKFGDQKYLDDWTERFNGIVYELKNLGGGVAPWNVQQYQFLKSKESIQGIEKSTNVVFDLVFFHFHALSFFKNWTIDLGSYVISNEVVKLIYKNYILDMKQNYNIINSKNTFLKFAGLLPKSNDSKIIFKKRKRKKIVTYNFYSFREIKRI